MNGWHLKKEISVTHLLTTLGLATAVLIFGLRLESSVNANTEQGARNAAAIVQLIEDDQDHAAIPIHAGASVEVARLSAEVAAMAMQLDRLDTRLQRQWDAFNSELRRRPDGMNR